MNSLQGRYLCPSNVSPYYNQYFHIWGSGKFSFGFYFKRVYALVVKINPYPVSKVFYYLFEDRDGFLEAVYSRFLRIIVYYFTDGVKCVHEEFVGIFSLYYPCAHF